MNVFSTSIIAHWQRLIAFNLAVIIGYLIYKIARDTPDLPYIHLLVDYHFGFTKRALIGALVSLGMDKVPIGMVFVLGSAILAVTFGLYMRLFQKTFGFGETSLPLFVFIVGSPFFFKNFVQTLGYFDIYGCAFAIALLMVPARSFAFVVMAAVGSVVLILIHHIHMLLYIPSIAAIVVIRYYLAAPRAMGQILAGVAMSLAIGCVFVITQVFGVVAASQMEFAQYVLGRMADPARGNPLRFYDVWFDPIGEAMRATLVRLPNNLLYMPIYAALFALHMPLIRYFRETFRGIASAHHRRIVLACIAMVGVGYLIILATVFDYARYLSDWAVCMVLILHGIKQLPAAVPAEPIATNDKRALWFAIVLTFLPKVGIIKPF